MNRRQSKSLKTKLQRRKVKVLMEHILYKEKKKLHALPNTMSILQSNEVNFRCISPTHSS